MTLCAEHYVGIIIAAYGDLSVYMFTFDYIIIRLV